jgi:hypothetical protein
MKIIQINIFLSCIRQPAQAQKEGPHATVYLVSGEQYKGDFHDNKRHGVC